MAAGKEFAKSTIKEPFLCAQLRLLDGQFKNHWKSTFSALKDKLKALELEMKRNKSGGPIHMFIMTDLPPANWTKTYLADIAKDEKYELYTLKENDVLQTAEKLMAAEHGLRSGFFPKIAESSNEDCDPVQLPEILLYVEESVCSCASLGFVGTAGSTIAGSIETMRMNNIDSVHVRELCLHYVAFHPPILSRRIKGYKTRLLINKASTAETIQSVEDILLQHRSRIKLRRKVEHN
ncbi:hypothetical protein QYE76_012633 [Lolium multiflorum]|uniref:Uncharacterized protein n=1 Tax=Lolium multiflorum TaxID=4521 RepID=A0AAD8TZ74_LOLMU|nr:hypothetical protein QYE76_012633 [Lolium multiflorum]